MVSGEWCVVSGEQQVARQDLLVAAAVAEEHLVVARAVRQHTRLVPRALALERVADLPEEHVAPTPSAACQPAHSSSPVERGAAAVGGEIAADCWRPLRSVSEGCEGGEGGK